MYSSKKGESILAKQYIESLPEKERKAYEIARIHLGCLLDIEKTNGFLKWKEEQYQLPK